MITIQVRSQGGWQGEEAYIEEIIEELFRIPSEKCVMQYPCSWPGNDTRTSLAKRMRKRFLWPGCCSSCLGYNPVTEFIYQNEVARKRERFAESLIASANKLAMICRAVGLCLYQTEQYLALVEDVSVLEAYKTLGVKQVHWAT